MRVALAAVIAVLGVPVGTAHAEVSELCRFDGKRLSEISGIATSAVHEGVVWAHNDSGGGPKLYALDSGTCEIRATINVRGTEARDPEAIAIGTGTTGAPVIWWGDIGDNTGARRYIEIHEIPEPRQLMDATVTPTTYRVRLDEPQDAEALLADGDRLWMIGKGLLGGTIWRLPTPLRSGEINRARAIGTEDALVTDAATRPGGGYAVRDYSEVRIYAGLPPGELIERMPLPEQVQGEAMTWTTDGTGLIVASEGDDRLLLVPVESPVEVVTPMPSGPPDATIRSEAMEAVPTPGAATSAPAEASMKPGSPSPVADALEPVDRVGSLAVIALIIGAAVFIVSAAAVPLVARARGHR